MTERDESYGAGLGGADEPGGGEEPAAHLLDAAGEHPGVPPRRRRRDRDAPATGVDEVLRDPATFSSSTTAHDLKAKRPLIPLQIDPPDHRKYRKLLDPLFAPQRMKAARGVDEPAGERPDRRLHRRAGDRLLGPVLDAVPLAGVPRRCSASRWTTCRVFLKMKDGAIRPDQVVGHEFGHPETEAYQQQTADSIYAYFEQVHRRARRASVRDDLLEPLPARRGGRGSPHPRGDPRHLLPVPHRRTRHRHGVARLLLRLPRASTPTPGARSSRNPTRSPRWSRSCCAGRRR